MERQIFHLAHEGARHNAIEAVRTAPEGWRVEVRPRNRTLDQNAMLHALFTKASKTCAWQGRKLTPIQWKTLFISAHSMATGRGADVMPGLEGEFVNVRESSAGMDVARMTSLIEYMQAWIAQNERVAA